MDLENNVKQIQCSNNVRQSPNKNQLQEVLQLNGFTFRTMQLGT